MPPPNFRVPPPPAPSSQFTVQYTTPPPRHVVKAISAQLADNHSPQFAQAYTFPPPTECSNIQRPVAPTPTLNSYTTDRSPGFIPVSKKRKGAIIHSSRPKVPRNSSGKRIHIYTANHKITGIPKPNCHLFQSPENTLPNIFAHLKLNLCDSRETRLVIFVSDFKLDFDARVGTDV